MRTNNLSQIICNARIFVPLRENEAVCVAASIKKPIHNVKEAGNSRNHLRPAEAARRQIVVFIAGVSVTALPLGRAKSGGAYRDRTDDPLLAKQVLSQLS